MSSNLLLPHQLTGTSATQQSWCFIQAEPLLKLTGYSLAALFLGYKLGGLQGKQSSPLAEEYSSWPEENPADVRVSCKAVMLRDLQLIGVPEARPTKWKLVHHDYLIRNGDPRAFVVKRAGNKQANPISLAAQTLAWRLECGFPDVDTMILGLGLAQVICLLLVMLMS